MKEYPGMSVDEILATDTTVWPFTREAFLPRCHARAFLNGKPLPGLPMRESPSPGGPMHLIFPDLDLQRAVRMKDVAEIEVYRFARRSNIEEPEIHPSLGTHCWPVIMIWTKDFKQTPYKGK
jgi:hypothetical protein